MAASRPPDDAAPARVLVPNLAAGRQRLELDEAHYVRRVLRLQDGDAIEAFDGRGRVARGRVVMEAEGAGADRPKVRPGRRGARDRRDDVLVELGAPEARPGPALQLTVALAHPKGERADWAVEKLTELGVARILWLTCARSVVAPGAGRLERQRRVALAAARQCGRADLPALDGPAPLEDALRTPAELRWVAHLEGDTPAADAGSAARGLVLIGPEGGWTASELEAARRAGYTAVRLGAWTLRVETAAVAAAATLLQRIP